MAEVRGIVLDGRDGQAVPGAEVRLDGNTIQTRSDRFGHFAFAIVPAGSHVLDISSPGYQGTHTEFAVEAGGSKQFQVSLVPAGLLQRTVVKGEETVGSEAARTAAGDEFVLQQSDLENLSSVIADDPMRALQALPGVASNDDFEARFFLRGADFSRTGIYLDGALIPNALHGLEGSNLLGSSSIFNPAMVDQLTLYKSAYPEKFGEHSAGAVSVESRDGDRDRYHLRLMANIAQAGFVAEGPLAKAEACSWIGGFRQSYIQSLLGDSIPDPSLAFSTRDAQGRITCHPSQKHTLTASLIDSWTYLDRSGDKSLPSTELMKADQHLWFANVAWTYAPSSNTLITNRATWIQDRYVDSDASRQLLGEGEETNESWTSDASWLWRPGNLLTAGADVRNVRGDHYDLRRFSAIKYPPQLNTGAGSDTLAGGYIEESWTGAQGHLRLAVGGRIDRDANTELTALSPLASLSVHLTPATQVDFGYAQYAQFPTLSVLDSTLGGHGLLPIRSNQATVAIEQRFGMNTRFRVEAYNRLDRDLLLQPYLLPRLVGRIIVPPSITPLYQNAGRGYGRGIELFVERKLARSVSGWFSYAYGHTKIHDGVLQTWYPSDYDQQQTVSAYVVYAWKPSVTLSSRWSYGSGFPIPGYLTKANGRYVLSDTRNGLRLPPYSRLDVRMNKAWKKEHMTIRLFAEVENLLNRTNYAFGSFNGWYGLKDPRADVSIQELFPILPSVGVVLEW